MNNKLFRQMDITNRISHLKSAELDYNFISGTRFLWSNKQKVNVNQKKVFFCCFFFFLLQMILVIWVMSLTDPVSVREEAIMVYGHKTVKIKLQMYLD